MKLSELKAGERCRILSVDADGATVARLKMLGLTKGAVVRFIKYPPFHSSMLLETSGTEFAVRTQLASSIEVKCLHG